jgi:hypothetical protein
LSEIALFMGTLPPETLGFSVADQGTARSLLIANADASNVPAPRLQPLLGD